MICSNIILQCFFVVTIQRGVSSAKFFLLLLSSARMGGTAAYDKFYFEITHLSDPSRIITLPCLSISSTLDWWDSDMQKCQLKTCWCCYSCQCCYWWGTYKRQFGRKAEVWSRYQGWISCNLFLCWRLVQTWGHRGLVKILKLKFGQYFEAYIYLIFENLWKYKLGNKD